MTLLAGNAIMAAHESPTTNSEHLRGVCCSTYRAHHLSIDSLNNHRSAHGGISVYLVGMPFITSHCRLRIITGMAQFNHLSCGIPSINIVSSLEQAHLLRAWFLDCGVVLCRSATPKGWNGIIVISPRL
jgi:hypothetical protein